MPLFRRAPEPPRAEPEAVEITLGQMKIIERAILRARELGQGGTSHHRTHTSRYIPGVTWDLIADMYRRAGAASVVEQDQDRVRIPFFAREFGQLEDAVLDIEEHGSDRALASAGRELLYGFHALIGRARAVRHMGGTPVFEPSLPQLSGGEQ